MVPLLLGGAALWGLSNMADAESKTDRANSINAQAAQIAENAKRQTERAHGNMTQTLGRLGRTKMDIMSGNINTVASVMGRIYKNFKINGDSQGLRELEASGIDNMFIEEMKALSDQAINIQNTQEFKSSSVGSFCAVGALGGAVLGLGAIAAPAMLIYSFMKTDEAEAALYEAKTRLDEARYYEERSKNICALFNAIARRGEQINNLLVNLNYYFDSAVFQMRNTAINDSYFWKDYPEEYKVNIFYAWQIAQTVKIIIDTSMIQEDWSINPDINKPIEMGEQTLGLLSA